MALLPAMMLAIMLGRVRFEGWMDSVMYGRHSIIWLYAGVFLVVGGTGGLLIVLSQKVPLVVSIPLAIVMWIILACYISKLLI